MELYNAIELFLTDLKLAVGWLTENVIIIKGTLQVSRYRKNVSESDNEKMHDEEFKDKCSKHTHVFRYACQWRSQCLSGCYFVTSGIRKTPTQNACYPLWFCNSLDNVERLIFKPPPVEKLTLSTKNCCGIRFTGFDRNTD